MSRRLVLASSSPYRRSLLERLGLPFSAVAPSIDETPRPSEPAAELVARLAEEKARAVAGRVDDAVVIGSDQVAVLDGATLGKPGTEARAVVQLTALSGRAVEFLTGLCVLDTATGEAAIDVVPFRVIFRALTRPEIEAYVRRERAWDCAGGFKSEALGIALFSALDGEDPSALVGLPLIRLCAMLRGVGLDPLLAGPG